MSHKSGHIIISRYKDPTGGSVTAVSGVSEARIELEFAPGTSLEERVKKVRQVERLLDKMDHDDED
jgi:hypothetical protein